MNTDTIAVLVPVCALGLWFGIWGLWKFARTRRKSTLLERSIRWNEVEETVKSAAVVWGHVEIIYAYETPDGRFEGMEEIGLPMVPFSGVGNAKRLNEAAKSVKANFPSGQTVMLRYNPEKPCESVFVAKV